MFKLIAKSVLTKLGEVALDKHQFGSTNEDAPYIYGEKSESASSNSTELGSLKSDWLGIGTARTWHGYPDARFRIANNDTTLLTHHDDLVEADDDTPGDSVTIEATLQISSDILMQLVPTSVLVGFIERNLHRDLSPMVPTILITPTRALICIYVVSRDFLLLSEPFYWIRKGDEQCGFNKTGFLLLWLALNHRYSI